MGEIKKYVVAKSGDFSPEQYFILEDDNVVGYIRVRNGIVVCEDNSGNTIYKADIMGDGCFNDNERRYHIKNILFIFGKNKKDF